MDDGNLTIVRDYAIKLSLFNVKQNLFIDKRGNNALDPEDKILFDNEMQVVMYLEDLDHDDPFPVAPYLIIVKVVIDNG